MACQGHLITHLPVWPVSRTAASGQLQRAQQACLASGGAAVRRQAATVVAAGSCQSRPVAAAVPHLSSCKQPGVLPGASAPYACGMIAPTQPQLGRAVLAAQYIVPVTVRVTAATFSPHRTAATLR
jgi:hypothetical protein